MMREMRSCPSCQSTQPTQTYGTCTLVSSESCSQAMMLLMFVGTGWRSGNGTKYCFSNVSPNEGEHQSSEELIGTVSSAEPQHPAKTSKVRPPNHSNSRVSSFESAADPLTRSEHRQDVGRVRQPQLRPHLGGLPYVSPVARTNRYKPLTYVDVQASRTPTSSSGAAATMGTISNSRATHSI